MNCFTLLLTALILKTEQVMMLELSHGNNAFENFLLAMQRLTVRALELKPPEIAFTLPALQRSHQSYYLWSPSLAAVPRSSLQYQQGAVATPCICRYAVSAQLTDAITMPNKQHASQQGKSCLLLACRRRATYLHNLQTTVISAVLCHLAPCWLQTLMLRKMACVVQKHAEACSKV